MVYKLHFLLKNFATKFSKIVIPFLLMHSSLSAVSQKVIPLYKGIPNSIKTENLEKETHENGGILIVSNVPIPTLTIYSPVEKKANGTAVIICPGGGYGILAADHEGYAVAKRFNDMGITAFVLKYRLPNDATMPDKSIGPLQDAQ
ncbi:MAG: alpha/beta hydrolase, partial [Ginsengibacter sp.]